MDARERRHSPRREAVGTLSWIYHRVNGWKSLSHYIGFLIEARDRFEGDGKFDGPLAPVNKSVLTGRFYVKNRIQRVRNARKLAVARGAPYPSSGQGDQLVSVVIPTHNRCALLMERAIPSVLNQTYRNIELIVVGDNCTDDTGLKVRGLGMDRARFFELPHTSERPERGYDAWLFAGVDATNMGIRLSSGDWIVHLDDDDELAPEHIEVLLRFASEKDLEMVYGKVLVTTEQGYSTELGSFPPELGKISHSGVLYSSRLRFLSYDRNAWRYLEPCDWNLWRRMKEAGVRIGFLDRVLGFTYPAGPASYCCQ